MTRRLVPVLIVATVLALIAAMGADHPAAPVPASAVTETTKSTGAETDSCASTFSLNHAVCGTKSTTFARAFGKKETPRQKAHRIIAATWPASQVTNIETHGKSMQILHAPTKRECVVCMRERGCRQKAAA